MRSFKKGNNICGVHINSIKGKDQRTKELGKNPFDYLAVKFSDSGLTVTMYEWKDGKWKDYSDIDGSPSYRCQAVAKKLRGEFYQLSKLKNVYDWTKNDGYKNFANWV